MCAILGVVGEKLPDEEKFVKARDALAHRGPDDAGLYYDSASGVALGHRRLSIIDLSSAGRQPLWSNDGRYAIVFNGEVYNYRELKSELAGSYDFKTHTDTEVLLAAYIVWGKKALPKLNGMFAFAVWDKKRGELFAARDRLGVKPFLYHMENNGALSFASEIKGLLALGVEAKPNDALIYDYLAHGLYDHRFETWFEGIHKLPAGHFLTFQKGKLSIEKYWDLADVATSPATISLEKGKQKFLELFEDAIRLRLRSDVPVGLNLSSGLDSAAILYFAEKNYQKPFELFSMRSSDPLFDEGALIEPMLTKTQRSHWHTSALSKPTVSDFEKVLFEQEEPYGGIPTLAYTKLAECAKKAGVTVILEGQGGDELFAGYRYFRPEFLREETAGRSQDATIEVSQTVLHPAFVALHKREAWKAPQPFDSALLNAQYRDLMHTKLPRVLRFNDRLSMAASREYRQPFLDYRLVEFAFFLPDDLKIRGGVQKFLLREAMQGIIPPEIGAREKKTFGALQTPLFREALQKPITDILTSASFRSRPYFDHRKVAAAAERFFAGESDNSFFIWQWVNLELWFRSYIDSTE